MNTSNESGRCPVTGHQAALPIDSGPKGWPLIGYTLKWLKAPLMSTLRVQRDHGEVAWLRLTGRPAVQVTSAKGMRRILVTNAGNYRRGKYHVGLREWMGEGLITLDGDRWREHRKILQPAFNAKQLSDQFQYIVYGANKQLSRWEQLATDKTPVDLVDEMNELVSRAFGMALIKRDLDKDLIRAVAIASESVYRRSVGLELIPWFIPTRYNRRKRWAHKKLDAVAKETAAARPKSDDSSDIVGQMLKSQMSQAEFRDNLRTIFLAGADTTAMGLAWAMWELAMHPETRDQVEHEIDTVLEGREPVEGDVASLPICRAVVDEALRLHPPIWVMPRNANGPDEVDGRAIPANANILMPFWGIQRSPKYWRDPDSFDHRRFLGESAEHRNGAYFPFGAGKHQCVGKDLALVTLVTAVAMLSQRFRVSVDGTEVVTHRAYTTLQPSPGLRVTVEERPGTEDRTASNSSLHTDRQATV